MREREREREREKEGKGELRNLEQALPVFSLRIKLVCLNINIKMKERKVYLYVSCSKANMSHQSWNIQILNFFNLSYAKRLLLEGSKAVTLINFKIISHYLIFCYCVEQ